MPTRDVNLTDHYDHFVENLIASGRYKNASEVMRAGLRLLERESKEDAEKLAVSRGLASEAFAALDRGEGTRLEGDQELADFIGAIGRRAAKRAGRRNGGK
ncbi:MAG: type II toxin-antitoxin system ParD family antitoxin [Isosphaeraceae bacterium]